MHKCAVIYTDEYYNPEETAIRVVLLRDCFLFSHPFLRPEALNFLFQSILFPILLRFAYQPIQ